MFREIIKAIVLGIVEGITEWLPISSTGHMILVEEFIKFDASAEFMEMFRVVIQLGAILAVVLLYFHKLNPFAPSKTLKQKRDTMDIWFKVIVGVLPAAVLGFLFDDWFDANFYNYQTVTLTLILYGILFIVIENKNKGKPASIRSFKDMSYKTALMIGFFQVLSLVPGTSRSGATILGAIILGTSRNIAAEYSFFLSIPVMFGASALKLVKFGFVFTGLEMAVLVTGMAVAFFISLISIRFLLRYIKNNDFKAFVMMLILSPILTSVVFAMLVVMLYTVKYIGKKSAKNFRMQQASLADVNGYIEEMMTGQKVVKVFNYEDRAIRTFFKKNEELKNASTLASTYGVMLMPVMGNLSFVKYALVSMAGAYLVMINRLSIGNIASFLQYTRSVSRCYFEAQRLPYPAVTLYRNA